MSSYPWSIFLEIRVLRTNKESKENVGGVIFLDISMSSKGQVTLPVVIRRRLGLKKGTRLSVELRNGEIVLIPQRGFENLRGFLTKELSHESRR